jgi:ribosomal subunit interface protein
MHVQVRYQGLDHTPWMDDFINRRVSRLNRYLDQSSSIHINLRMERQNYVTSIAIHNPHMDYAFSTVGLNLFESLTGGIEKALRTLSNHKREIKDKINKSFFSLKELP